MKRLLVALGVASALAASATAFAAEPVKIGILLPLSGNAGAAGQAEKAAIEVALDVINNAHPELKGLPLAESAGLPHLGNAKLEPLFVDHEGNPQVGQTQALRLITQEKVTALFGAYQSSVTLTATAAAERYGIPFVVGDSAALNITGRGFKWVFRVTPIASDYAEAYMRFLPDMQKAGHKVDSIAIINENTDYGTSVADSVEKAAKDHGFKVAARIPYNANAADVSPQVLQLKQKNPDVLIFVSYTSDAILYMRTMKELDYLPPMIIGDDTGFSDPSFIPSVGGISQGVMNRSAWDIGKPGSVTFRINGMYKAKTGRDLDDTSGRDMQGFFVLADAIDRAGSTEPAKIQEALRATNLAPSQLMMGYRGVKFDATGQNIEAATYLIQLQGGQYVAVWPPQAALAPLQWPMTGWKK